MTLSIDSWKNYALTPISILANHWFSNPIVWNPANQFYRRPNDISPLKAPVEAVAGRTRHRCTIPIRLRFHLSIFQFRLTWSFLRSDCCRPDRSTDSCTRRGSRTSSIFLYIRFRKKLRENWIRWSRIRPAAKLVSFRCFPINDHTPERGVSTEKPPRLRSLRRAFNLPISLGFSASVTVRRKFREREDICDR